MQAALDTFRDNINRSENISVIYLYITHHATKLIDPSDLLRLELAHLMSSFDKYIHDITLIGVKECFLGTRMRTAQYDSFQLPANIIHDYISMGNIDIVVGHIYAKHSLLTFQDPDKMADAIRLFHSNNIWMDLQAPLGKNAKDLKRNLSVIYNRRNKIVHESDIDPTSGNLWPVDRSDVDNAKDYLIKLVENVHLIIK